ADPRRRTLEAQPHTAGADVLAAALEGQVATRHLDDDLVVEALIVATLAGIARALGRRHADQSTPTRGSSTPTRRSKIESRPASPAAHSRWVGSALIRGTDSDNSGTSGPASPRAGR